MDDAPDPVSDRNLGDVARSVRAAVRTFLARGRGPTVVSVVGRGAIAAGPLPSRSA